MSDTYISLADLGGTTGHGPIEREPEGVTFHHEWEAKAFALTLAAGAPGGWNIDMSRSARETLSRYLSMSYYEIWTIALERLLVGHGLISRQELAHGRARARPDATRPDLTADRGPKTQATGGPADREPPGPARFTVGDRVLTRAGHVDHHTRLPTYAAGHVGTIEHIHGAHVFPDTNGHGLGEQPAWLYTVVFEATDLWDDAEAGQRVSVDAWEPYLSPVGTQP
ncbi:MAG: nitrile hydratase subunit beta [Ilumatobacter sp.]